ncbi:hypothetical protein BDK51DRAFT_47430 [Blyttiomyces helicus]|uniref:Uncharacterized protein n=1 Tax=Blyttiomyces helicus TaxID=388810 RepID=A0A4V1IQQ3_9FUNG|nr:hypothetical protein BDK51DRAFT_47430 [Blyttiomyces helicus]|eukprot:RKO87357.1 hypothetical protein BDK51DRAFT_47430 [Blyttiomyces helicus]
MKDEGRSGDWGGTPSIGESHWPMYGHPAALSPSSGHHEDAQDFGASIATKSASYVLGVAANDSLQRVYGIYFPDKNLIDEHKKFLEQAKNSDNRRIGQVRS